LRSAPSRGGELVEKVVEKLLKAELLKAVAPSLEIIPRSFAR
jgi:hypothetical protein